MATKDNLVQLTTTIIGLTLASIIGHLVAVHIANDEFFEFFPLDSKKSGILNVSDLCVNGKTDTCTKLTLEQVTSVCGGSIEQEGLPGKGKTYHNYTKVEAKCIGATCHGEIATNNEWYHTGLDCTQNGTKASCKCQPYERVKLKTTASG
uniref:Uncharacterized protein n=1 Tax=Cacopsylla melanoneura TaxID=428564 RepID=A0A8D9DVI6_9HEMI